MNNTYMYYLTERPFSIGTVPNERDVISFKNFDSRIWLDEIKHMAWGYVVYPYEIDKKTLDHFSMRAPIPAEDDLAVRLNTGEFILVFTADDGSFDYSIYNKAFCLLDGGQIDGYESYEDLVKDIAEERKARTWKKVDAEKLRELVA